MHHRPYAPPSDEGPRAPRPRSPPGRDRCGRGAGRPARRPAGGRGDARACARMGPLPACRYDDILTAPRSLRGLVDRRWSTRSSACRRPTCRPTSSRVVEPGIPGGGKVRAGDDRRPAGDGRGRRDRGRPRSAIQSAYRSYEQQKAVFAGWVDVHGYARALQLSARPGHSEHQLGVAIDFRSRAAAARPSPAMWARRPRRASG